MSIVAEDCDLLLADNTVAMLGNDPTCIWESASVLHINFGTNPTITTSDILATKSDVLRAAIGGPYNSFSQDLPITSPENPVQAVAVLTGSTTVGVCDPAFLDASMSYGNGGRALEYVWTLDPSLNSDVDSSIQAAIVTLFSTAGSTPTITIGTDMLEEATFVISLEISNWIGSMDSITFTFDREGVALPVLTLNSPQVTTFVSQAVAVSVSATAPDDTCTTTTTTDSSSAYTFQWEKVEGPTLDFTFPTLSGFTLPAYLLVSGSTYILRATVTYTGGNGESSTVTADMTIMTSVSELVAVLSPGDSLQSKDHPEIICDASDSFDPDLLSTDPDSFVYAWSCVTGSGVDCMTGQADAATTERTFTYDTTSSSPDETYTIGVTVGDGAGRESTTLSVLSFTVDTVPVVTLTTE